MGLVHGTNVSVCNNITGIVTNTNFVSSIHCSLRALLNVGRKKYEGLRIRQIYYTAGLHKSHFNTRLPIIE